MPMVVLTSKKEVDVMQCRVMTAKAVVATVDRTVAPLSSHSHRMTAADDDRRSGLAVLASTTNDQMVPVTVCDWRLLPGGRLSSTDAATRCSRRLIASSISDDTGGPDSMTVASATFAASSNSAVVLGFCCMTYVRNSGRRSLIIAKRAMSGAAITSLASRVISEKYSSTESSGR